MFILKNSKMDKGRRIDVGVFGVEAGDILTIVIDVENECIRIFNKQDIPESMVNFGDTVKVDSKNRIIIPPWIAEEIGKETELRLVLGDDGEKFIIKKTKNFFD